MGKRRGDRNFLSKIFYLTVPKNFVWKISVKETSFMGRREWAGGGLSVTFSVEIFLANIFEKNRRGTLLCFRRFFVWQKN